jgi:hypothetical protein
MPKEREAIEEFLDCSALVTGFGRMDLLGTGMTEAYYKTLTGTVGESICSELWAEISKLKAEYGRDPERLEEEITKQIVIGNPKLGPVVKSLVQMWYLGQWGQTPPKWRAEFGTNPNDYTRILSAEAYTQALVWNAAGTHPQGAKQPGYGSWSQAPVQIAVSVKPAAKKAATGE